ncbi:glycosyltransferase [Xylophilus sp. GW821-FHT01B05]
MNSRLYRARKPQPYYIYAPDYADSSSGIAVLHYLCHALNLEGCDAFIALGSVVKHGLKTPLLTEADKEAHRRAGRMPIAVYPEIVTGNPLGADVCVRYMLNREGFLNGNRLEAGPADLFFYFSPEFAEPGTPPAQMELLTLPPNDMALFAPDPANPRGRKFLYLHRFAQERVDFTHLPPDIEILSNRTPVPLAELARLLQSADVLYSYERSATCTKAMLCGCPVVYLREGGLTTLPGQHLYGDCGAAMIDTPGGLEHARASVDRIRGFHARLEEVFWQQLERFVTLTQARADAVAPVLHWAQSRLPSQAQGRLMEARLQQHGGGPSICVFLRDLQGDSRRLEATLKSLVFGQGLYANLKIVVLTAAPVSGTTAADKIHLVQVEEGGYVEALNALAAQSDCDWLLLADAGDEFTRAGLLQVALRIIDAPQWRAVYADELRRLPGGGMGVALRPAFNLDLLLSLPASMARRWLVRRDVLLGVGGFDPAAAEALEFDLLLRLIDAGGIEGLGHVDEPLLTADAPVLADKPAERRVLQRHLEQRGYGSAEVHSTLPGRYRVEYGHAQQPLVSIIITARDPLPVLQRCVEGLLEKTRYPHYELLILDQGSEAADMRAWLDGVAAMGSEQVRVLRAAQALGTPAACNAAAREARGEYLLLLDPDTAVLHEDWLDALLNHAQRPEVGVVGAKLLRPDGRVQHAGLVLGLQGPAGHPFVGQPLDAGGYMHRLEVDQGYSAVAATCLMVRKSLYDEVGGFDEAAFQQAYGDVDLCLKVRSAGYLVVWTPHAMLMHEGPEPAEAAASEARHVAEEEMYARWLPSIARDPAYNRSLTLQGPGFELETAEPYTWRPLDWRPLPVVRAMAADENGCGHYRVIQPHQAMEREGLIQGVLGSAHLSPVQLERQAPDAIVFQRQLLDGQIEWMRKARKFSGAFKVYELDDYLPGIPLKSAHWGALPNDVLKSLRKALGHVDRFVVSTPALAEAFSGLHPDIRVVRNRLPPAWWAGLQGQRRRGARPRVGWAGGGGHRGDLELVADVVAELAGEVEWVFFGMCPEKLRPFVAEVHPGVPIAQYPAALARLDLDLALAPLEHNLFNECKSNLRLLEYGACGFPVVCSDVRCYSEDGLPVTRVKNRFKDWVAAIRMHLDDLDATARVGDELRAAVTRDWMLDGKNLLDWRAAWLPA